MKRVLRITCYLLVASALMMSTNAFSQDRADDCESLWLEASSKYNTERGVDYAALLSEWRSLSDKCSGTGVYEAHLSSLYIVHNDFGAARKCLDDVEIPDKYYPLRETVLLNIDLIELLSTGKIDKEKMHDLEKRSEALIQSYPDYLPGYGYLGHIKVLGEKYGEAIPFLEKASNLDSGDLVGIYRNLAIAYSFVGEYEKSLSIAGAASKMNKGITNDEEFMYAVAASYAALGKTELSKKVLTIIVNKNPNLQDDPGFIEAVRRAKELSGGKLR